MVEPSSGNRGLQFIPNSKAENKEIAKRDFEILANAIANRQGDVTDLFVMSLRIMEYLADRPKPVYNCMVCEQHPRSNWRLAGLTQYERTFFHCNAHVEEFHREVGHIYICCTPFYHPLCNFDWRDEGQGLIAERANPNQEEPAQMQQPEESEDNDSHSSWKVPEQSNLPDDPAAE